MDGKHVYKASASSLPVVPEENGDYLISSSLEQTIDALIQPSPQRRRRRQPRPSLEAPSKSHGGSFAQKPNVTNGQEHSTSNDKAQSVQQWTSQGENGGQIEQPQFQPQEDHSQEIEIPIPCSSPQGNGDDDDDEEEEEASPFAETFSLSAFSSLPDYHDLIDAVLELQESHNPSEQLQGLEKIKNFSPGDILMTDGWVGIRNQLLALLTMKKDRSEQGEVMNAKRLELHNAILDTLYSLFSAACSGNSPQTIEIALGVVRHLYVQQNVQTYYPHEEYLETTVASSFGLLVRMLYDLGDKEVLPDENLLSQYQTLLFLLLGKGLSTETCVQVYGVQQKKSSSSYLEHFFHAMSRLTQVAGLRVPHAPFLERFLGSFAATSQAAIFAFQTGLIDILQEYLLSVNQRSTGSKHRDLKITFATILFVKLTEKLTALPLDRKFPILCRCSNGTSPCQLHNVSKPLIEAAKINRVFDTLFGIENIFAESEMPDLDSIHSDVSSPKQTKVWNFELHHDHGLTSYIDVKTDPLANYNGLYCVLVWDQCSTTTSNLRDGPRKAVYLSDLLFKHVISFVTEYLKSDEQHDLSFQTIIQLCRLLSRLPVYFEQQFEALLQTLVSHEAMTKEINSAEATILSFDYGSQILGGCTQTNERSFWQCVLSIPIDATKDIATEFAPKLSALRGLVAAAIHHSQQCPSQAFFENASKLLSELPTLSGAGNGSSHSRSVRNENHVLHICKMLKSSLLQFPMYRHDMYTADTFSLVERYRLNRENVESFSRSVNEVFPYFSFILSANRWGLDKGTVEVMESVVKRTLDCLLGSYVLSFPQERELETFLHGAMMIWSEEIRKLLECSPNYREWRLSGHPADGIALTLVQMAFMSDAVPFFWRSVGTAGTRRIAPPYALELGTSLLQTAIICFTSFSGYAIPLQTKIAEATISARTSINGGREVAESILQSYVGILMKDSELCYTMEREIEESALVLRLVPNAEPACINNASSDNATLQKAWEDTLSAINVPANTGEQMDTAALFWMGDTHFSSKQQLQNLRLMSLQLASAFLLKNVSAHIGIHVLGDDKEPLNVDPKPADCLLSGNRTLQAESNGGLWLALIQQVYGIPRVTTMKPSTLDETMYESFSMLFSIFEHHFPEGVDVAGIKTAFVKTLQGQYPSTGDERIRTVDVATSYINSVCPFLRAVLHSFYLSEYIPMMYWLELRFLGHLTFSQYMWLHVLFLIYGERIWSAALVTLLYQRIRAIISKHTYIHRELTSGELLQKICTPSDAYPTDFDGSLLLSVVRAMKRE